MKPRLLKSFPAALTQIQVRLESDVCARIVDRSESLIRKWANPEHEALPNIEQAFILDAEFMKRGCGSPPILRVYQERLAILNRSPGSIETDIVKSVLSIHELSGQCSAYVKNACGNGKIQTSQLSPDKKKSILKILARLKEEIDGIEDCLTTSSIGKPLKSQVISKK